MGSKQRDEESAPLLEEAVLNVAVVSGDPRHLTAPVVFRSRSRLPGVTYYHRGKVAVFRVLAWAAMALEVAYAGFLGLAIRDSILSTAVKLGYDVSGFNLPALYTVSFVLAGVNLICDLLSADPAKESDELAGAKTESYPWQRLVKGILVFATITSFVMGAAADVIPFNALIGLIPAGGASNSTAIPFRPLLGTPLDYALSGMANGALLAAENNFWWWPKVVLRHLALAITAGLGAVYYYMITINYFKMHVKALRELILDRGRFWKDLAGHRMKFFEGWLQVFCNILYRAISFGFIVGAVTQSMWNVDPSGLGILIPTVVVFLCTVAVTLVSRVKQVLDGMLAGRYLKGGEYSQAVAGKVNMAFSVANGLFRGLGVALCIYGLVPASLGLGAVLASAIVPGLAAAIHHVAVMYTAHRALQAVGGKSGLTDRMGEASAGADQRIAAKAAGRQGVLPALPAASAAGAAQPGSATSTPPDLARAEVRAGIVDRSYGTVLKAIPPLAGAASVAANGANAIARLARLIGFIGFVDSLARTVGLNLNLYTLLGVSAFWAGGVFLSEIKNYGAMIMDTIQAYRARMFMALVSRTMEGDSGFGAAALRAFAAEFPANAPTDSASSSSAASSSTASSRDAAAAPSSAADAASSSDAAAASSSDADAAPSSDADPKGGLLAAFEGAQKRSARGSAVFRGPLTHTPVAANAAAILAPSYFGARATVN